MTDHAPMPVKGYTSQSDAKVAMANELKEAEERYLRILDRMRAAGSEYDQRSVSEAFTCMQTGAMWAVRAVFQPQRVKLPDDAS